MQATAVGEYTEFSSLDRVHEEMMRTTSGDRINVKTAIAPLLSVRNGAKAVEFFKSAFGAIEMFRVEDPSGAVVARLRVNDAEFWLSDESPEHQNFSPESLGGGTVRMILTVADPDSVFAQAVSVGARVVFPVGEAYGWRLGRVVFWSPLGNWATTRSVTHLNAQTRNGEPSNAM